MAETLADFAQRNGVRTATVRSWKHRGQIVFNVATGLWDRNATLQRNAPPATPADEIATVPIRPEVATLGATLAIATPRTESCAGCLVQAARLESCEHAIESLRSDMSSLRDHVGALEALIADLKAANRDAVAGQLRHGQTVRRNGRTEIADGDYLESQRWE